LTTPSGDLGRNAQAVTNLVADLRREDQMDSHGEALATLALTLAGVLDDGVGMATAAVARELRATLDKLTESSHVDDDDDWVAGVSAEVRDASKS